MRAIVSLIFAGMILGLMGNVCYAQNNFNKVEYADSLFDDAIDDLDFFTQKTEINNFTYSKGGILYTFESGTFYLGKEISGKIRTAFFKGSGNIFTEPNDYTEKENLRYSFNSKILSQNFEEAFFYFDDDSTLSRFMNFSFEKLKNKNPEMDFLNFEELFYSDHQYNSDFAISLLNNNTGYFLSLTKHHDDFNLVCMISRFPEPTVVLNKISSNGLFEKRTNYLLYYNDYTQQIPYLNLDVESYDITLDFESDPSMKASCGIKFAKRPDDKWIIMDIFQETNVSSILCDGKKIPFIKNEEEGILYIKNEMIEAESDSITIFYSSDIFSKNAYAWINLKDPTGWYPSPYNSDDAYFYIHLSMPDNYRATAAGNLISEETEGDRRFYYWRTPFPISFAGLNISNYNAEDYYEDNIPAVTVLLNDYGHREIANALIALGYNAMDNIEEEIADDILKSLSFYSNIFGALPFSHIYAAESGYIPGQAFPGVVNFSWMNFLNTDEYGTEKTLRAHEVAHQWWGVQVKPKTYREQWLFEGLAEFSSLWYLQTEENDNENYFEILDQYKERIIEAYTTSLSDEERLGSIDLGFRNNYLETEGGSTLFIYLKSSYLFHMIRTMMIDLKTMNEDRFKNFLRDFYNSNFGKQITNSDFKYYLSKHMGEDMSWFMDQWVYKSAIPEIEWSYFVVKQDNGKFTLKLKINQNGFGESFKAYVPIKIEFGNDQFAWLRIPLTGEVTELNYSNLSIRPEDVLFNKFNGLLCKSTQLDWGEL